MARSAVRVQYRPDMLVEIDPRGSRGGHNGARRMTNRVLTAADQRHRRDRRGTREKQGAMTSNAIPYRPHAIRRA